MDNRESRTPAQNLDMFAADPAREEHGVLLRERACRTLIGACGIPGVDYAANPYAGCAHGCVYCYARHMAGNSARTRAWGAWADARVNAADIAAKQLASGLFDRGHLLLGSVTDAYQPAEETYKLARSLLGLFARRSGSLGILTKSPLITRDMDILNDIPGVSVGITITGVDERARAAFEPGAPPYADRLAALEKLSAAGLDTWAFVAPVLPGVTDHDLPDLLQALRSSGVRRIVFDKLNHVQHYMQELVRAARIACPEALPQYRVNPGAAAARLKHRIRSFESESGIPCKMYF
jgi:DNA repair photolyase